MRSGHNPSPEQPDSLRGLRPRNIYLSLLVGLSVSAFLIYTTFDVNAFRAIPWTSKMLLFLALCLALMVVRHILYMYRVWLVTGKVFRLRQTFSIITMWEFASAVTPGIVGGAAVAMFILNRERLSMGKSTASVMVITFMDNLFFISMALAMFLVVGYGSMFGGTEGCYQELNLPLLHLLGGVPYVFLIGISFSILLTGLLVYGLLANPAGLKVLLMRFTGLRLFRKLRPKAEQTGNDIIVTSKELRRHKPQFWLRIFLVTALAWVCKFLVVNMLITAFAGGFMEPGDQLSIFSRMLVLWLIMVIPILPGSSGVAEITFMALMCSFMDLGIAATITFLWRMLTFYPYLLLGAATMPRWLNRTLKEKRVKEFEV